MGIKGLKSYIEHQGIDIKEYINLCDEIHKWKAEHEMNEPVILIDLKGWGFNLLRKDRMNVALGIRFHDFNKRYLRFINHLRATGAKLVFFVVGRKQTDDTFFQNIESEITTFNSTYNHYINLMDAIENETEFLSIRNVLELSWTKDNIRRMSIELGEFHVTHSLHNWEIAEYLCSQPVMAIITDDSDFLAIDGRFQYWILSDIDFSGCRTMDGGRYSKDKLNSQLNLIPQRVHSIDVLVGSDSMPFGLKSEFDALLNRLTSWYEWRFNQNVIIESELMEFCKTKHPIVYKLLTYKILKIAGMFWIDYRMFRNYSYAELVMPLIMKLCGILNKDEHSPPQTRKIVIKFAHEESAVVRDEEIVYPNMDLPSTYELIANPEDNDYDEYRWCLLAWVLNFDSDLISKIRSMHHPSMLNINVVILSLQYLLQHHEIRSEEAYIVLLTEIEISQKENHPKEKGFVIYPKNPNVTYVRMAHLYPKIYCWVNRCLVVCGLSSITDLIRFDGPLYHNLMEELNAANESDEKDDLISKAKAIWMFDD